MTVLLAMLLATPVCAEPPARMRPAARSLPSPAPNTTPASPSAPPEPSPWTACGPLECQTFPSAAAAFQHILLSQPLVLGIGEAHALAGSEHLASTARRFTEELLPVLDSRASHLLVELLNPNPSCQTTNQQVQEAHKPVTEPQSRQNQNDYVLLGQRAKALGIEPYVLSPTCEEYQAIILAGSDAIAQTLTTIAEITARMARGALVKNRAAGREQLVVAYGGALHNDIAPDAARAAWSYGPQLSGLTRGRYVAVDLIVRELIKDNEVWRALPWYAYFDPKREPDSSVLMRITPNDYVLFFPKTRASGSAVP